MPDPANPQSLNRYSCVLNNPLLYTDPSGHRECGPACEGDVTSVNNIDPCLGTACFGYWFSGDEWGRGWTAQDTEAVLFTVLALAGGMAAPELIAAGYGTIGEAGWKVMEWVLRHKTLSTLLGWGGGALASDGDPSNEVRRFLEGREAYENQVRALREEGERMLAEGQSMEKVARWAHGARRALGVAFKDVTPPKLLEYILPRNIERYDDELGPSIEWLRVTAGKTWEEIFESATRPGGDDIIPLLIKLLEG